MRRSGSGHSSCGQARPRVTALTILAWSITDTASMPLMRMRSPVEAGMRLHTSTSSSSGRSQRRGRSQLAGPLVAPCGDLPGDGELLCA